MRLAGATYQQIATALGVTVSGVASIVRSVEEELRRESSKDAATWRAYEMQRLEGLLGSWIVAARGYERVDATTGKAERVAADPKAARIVLDIMEQEAKLLGLYQATEVRVTVSVEERVKRVASLYGLDPEVLHGPGTFGGSGRNGSSRLVGTGDDTQNSTEGDGGADGGTGGSNGERAS